MIMNRLSTGLCVLALAGAALGSYACGNGKQTAGFNGADSGSDGGSTSSSSGSSGSGGSSGATATPPDGGIFVADGGTSDGGDFGGSSSGTVTVACPMPSTQNDFTAPVIDTGVAHRRTDPLRRRRRRHGRPVHVRAPVRRALPEQLDPPALPLHDGASREPLRDQAHRSPTRRARSSSTRPQNAYTLHALAWQKITSVGVNGPIRSASEAPRSPTARLRAAPGPARAARSRSRPCPPPAASSTGRRVTAPCSKASRWGTRLRRSPC